MGLSSKARLRGSGGEVSFFVFHGVSFYLLLYLTPVISEKEIQHPDFVVKRVLAVLFSIV